MQFHSNLKQVMEIYIRPVLYLHSTMRAQDGGHAYASMMWLGDIEE